MAVRPFDAKFVIRDGDLDDQPEEQPGSYRREQTQDDNHRSATLCVRIAGSLIQAHYSAHRTFVLARTAVRRIRTPEVARRARTYRLEPATAAAASTPAFDAAPDGRRVIALTIRAAYLPTP